MTNNGPVSNDNNLFITSFSALKDYRRTTKGNLKSIFNEIIFLALSAVISGFNTYELIAKFGKYEIDWLRKFFPYEKQTPRTIRWASFIQKLIHRSLQIA